MKKQVSLKITKYVSLLISVFMILGLFTVTAFAAGNPGTDKADIVITKATAGDKFSAYKIMDINYDATHNTISYSWTKEVKAILDAKENTTTPDQFAAISNEDDRQEFVAVLTKYLVQGGTIKETQIEKATPVKTDIAADTTGKAIFSDLLSGEYLIVPTLTTSVYQIMIGVIQPTGDGTSWTIAQGDELAVKKTDGPTLDKKASETNVGSWTTINYSIVFDVPKYDGTVVDKALILNDKADSGLSYVGNLKISGLTGKEITSLTTADVTFENTTAIPAADTAEYNITLDFDYDKISSYQKILVTYDAKINNSAALKIDINNIASLTYSNYPYIEGSRKTITDKEKVNTFGIQIYKFDEAVADRSKAIANVKFDVYRPIENGETGITVNGISEQVIKVSEIETDINGNASLAQVRAGKYYLVETFAPSGYSILSSPVDINFGANDTDKLGYYKTEIGNKSGIVLPQTGGIGTTIFTVSGIVLMLGAVALLVIVKRKKATCIK